MTDFKKNDILLYHASDGMFVPCIVCEDNTDLKNDYETIQVWYWARNIEGMRGRVYWVNCTKIGSLNDFGLEWSDPV